MDKTARDLLAEAYAHLRIEDPAPAMALALVGIGAAILETGRDITRAVQDVNK